MKKRKHSDVFVVDEMQGHQAHVESFRELVPTHFVFKVQSFSSLSKSSIDKYESTPFEAGGFNWKLVLYPCGNKNENGKDHISLYLAMAETSSFAICSKIKVEYRLFLFDQIRDRYLFRGDKEGRTSRFHEMKTSRGFPQFLSLVKFKDPCNGYLVDDTCLFGAEVFIYKCTGFGECLLMAKEATFTVTHTWRIERFSERRDEYLDSELFKCGDFNWKVRVSPLVDSKGTNISDISIKLFTAGVAESSYGPELQINHFEKKVLATFILRIKNQNNRQDLLKKARRGHLFSLSSPNWGWSKFTSIAALTDKANGFLVNDVCIIEAEVTVIGFVNELN